MWTSSSAVANHTEPWETSLPRFYWRTDVTPFWENYRWERHQSLQECWWRSLHILVQQQSRQYYVIFFRSISISFVFSLQKLKGLQISLLALALFRHVTCRYKSPDHNIHPSLQVTVMLLYTIKGMGSVGEKKNLRWLFINSQETAKLGDLLRNITSRDLREFCNSLLSNQIGGPGSRIHISTDLSAQRQTLLELLVHLVSLLVSGDSLLVPLYHIAFQPENVTVRLIVVLMLHLYHFLPFLDL